MSENHVSTHYITKYRFFLKGRIHEAGFKTIGGFAGRVGAHISTISRIVNGWEVPSPGLQERMAKELGLTIGELGRLL